MPTQPRRNQSDRPGSDAVEQDRAAATAEGGGDADSGDSGNSGAKPRGGATRYLNISGSPIVYDVEGHSVAAGEAIEASRLDAVGQAALEHGHLLRHPAS
jgi:hypothetical protein